MEENRIELLTAVNRKLQKSKPWKSRNACIQFYHLLRHSCRIGSSLWKIQTQDWEMWAFLSKMIVFYGLVQYSWAVCLSVCSKYSIQFYHLLRHSCRIGSFTMKIDWRLALKRKQNVLFCFPLLSREKKRQKKRCWNPQKGLAFHTAKRSVSRSRDRSQKSPFTIGLLDDESNF